MSMKIRGRPIGSFIYLFLGGILIFLSGITWKAGSPVFGWPYFELSVEFRTETRLISNIGIACGMLVIASAILTLSADEEVQTIGGVLGLVFSIIGLASGGGWMVGSILAIIGGLLLVRTYTLSIEEEEGGHLPIGGLTHWLLGGVFIFINGYVWSVDQLKAHFLWSAVASTWADKLTHFPLAVWGMTCGVLVIVGAILSLLPREGTKNTGIVLGLLFSVISIASSGGWMLGFVLVIAGCLLSVAGR